MEIVKYDIDIAMITTFKAKRQADLLLDKEKLIAFADMLVELELPYDVKSEEAKNIIDRLDIDLDNMQSSLRKKAEAL